MPRKVAFHLLSPRNNDLVHFHSCKRRTRKVVACTMELRFSLSCRIGGFFFIGIFITISKSLYINNYIPYPEDERYCYTTDNHPFRYFATKTTYQAMQGDLSKIIPPQDCVAKQFWGLYRHGTRYPSVIDYEALTGLGHVLEAIKHNFREGSGELCYSDFELLQTWMWDSSIDYSQVNELTQQGYNDLHDIAERFRQKYPELFKDYDPDYYYHTISNRTKESFESFANGLFREGANLARAVESNAVIKEYKRCPLWQYTMYTDGSSHTDHYKKLIKTKPFLEMSERVSKRLGFPETLNDSIIVTMYRACAFEQAWDPETLSKWCTVFDKDDLKLLEYAEDIHIYYKSGYGSEFNPKLGCPIVHDIYQRLENGIKGAKDEPKVVAQFTHSTAFHQFITALGLYKDEIPPDGENYEIQGNRKWKTAIFGPSSTNFVGILYFCEDATDTYQVQFLLDENPFNIVDECVNGLCPWDAFKTKYKDTALSCDISFCHTYTEI